MFRSAILLLLPFAATIAQNAPTPGKASNSPSVPDQVDKIFAKWASTKTPGCALSVIRDGQIIYKRGYGMADLDHDVPISSETVFHIASLSKQFTAAAILLLAQDGKLSLDDDVRKYLPEIPDFGERISVGNLMYHTSGVRDQWDLLDLAGWRYSLDLITDDDILGLIARQKELNFKPGDEQIYSNTGYTLLGQIVKRASGQSLREFTTNRIFKPLEMPNTHFRDDHAEIVKHMAYGYEPVGRTYRMSVTNFDTVGATSLLTTVEDLAKWDENFYHPRVGGPALVEQQLRPGKLNNGKALDYAAGLDLGEYRGLPTVDHGGTDAGYRAELLRFPDQHFSVACLCNNRSAFPVELARQVADIYLAGEFKKPLSVSAGNGPTQGVVPAEQLARYAGLYWNKDTKKVRRIVFRDGKVFSYGIELLPLSQNRFQFIIDPEFTFTFSGTPASVQGERMTVREPGEAPATLDRIAVFRPTASQQAEYAGFYESDEIDPIYRIAARSGDLILSRPKSAPEKLTPLAEDYFEGLGGVMSFPRDQSGRIIGFVLDTDSTKHFRFRKVER